MSVGLLLALASPVPAQDVAVRVRAYIQVDSRVFLSVSAVPGANTFVLRRARPIVEATAFKYFDLRLMSDFGQGKVQLMEAYVDLRFRPQVVLRTGKFKPPVGLERLQSATDIRFVERGAPTNLVPSRDVGLELYGDLLRGGVSYAAGVFDGTEDLGNNDGDRSDAKDLVARLFFQPFVSRGPAGRSGLGLGIAASTGREAGSTTSSGLPSYRTPGQRPFFAHRADGTNAGTAVADGIRRRVVPQGFFHAGPFGLLWEYAVSSQRVRLGTASADLTHRAWQVAGSLVMTGEPVSYRGVVPRHAFDPDGGAWGALELALRYGEVHVDGDAFPTFANPALSASAARSWGVGLNWYLARGVRMIANYDRTAFSAAGAMVWAPEHFVVTRVQMGF